MQIVTLTTDWGTRDFFAGMVKGRLYSLIPDVQVVDITHDIESYNRAQAAFVISNACMEFPEGTIHIIDVDSHESKEHPYMVVEYQKQYFICADNGIAGVVFCDKPDVKVTRIAMYQDSNFFNFPAYNLFCFVAERIAAKAPWSEIGSEGLPLVPVKGLIPLTYPDMVKLYVMYVDSYGNAYLNMLYDDFLKLANNRKMFITAGVVINREIVISDSYYPRSSSIDNDLILTVSATGYLELAKQRDPADEIMGTELGAEVIITFV